MKEVVADKNFIAKCGLYCGACGKYLKGKCAGCAGNVNAAWCKVRECCIANNRATCAECPTYTDTNDCKSFNNIFSKLFGFIFGSDRKACVAYVKANGLEAYAKHMSETKAMTLKKL